MDKFNKKELLLQKMFRIARVIFYIIFVMVVLYTIVMKFVMPSEEDEYDNDCRLFQVQWEQVMDNGDRVPIEVPGKVDAKWGEVVTLATTLPEDTSNGQTLCFRPVWQDVDIYIDGELRKSYNTKKTRLFGKNSTARYLFVELTEEDAGKELTYQFSSYSKYAGRMLAVQIGDRSSIWFGLVSKTGLKTMIAIGLTIVGLLSIIVCVILRIVYKKSLSLIYLAWTIFFCAFWMLSESDFRQLIFENISTLSNVTYWSLMLIPFPLLLYINDVQNGHYKKLYFALISLSEVIFVVTTVLQVLDIRQFVEMLPVIHFGLIVSIVSLIATITIDLFTKRLKSYVFVGIGVYGMLFTGILELILYYMGASTSLGAVLGIGLLFFFIMAIIKTGQDFLETEKKKQQAIIAREAQAKFLANMSHEIRTPINAIMGMNEMILRENKSPVIEEYACNIQNASQMLLGLINDVLDFSKIESGQLELVEDTYSLAALIKDTMLLTKTRAGERSIETKMELDSAIPSKLRGDELRIKQILTNILSNAVKYTNEGSVTLKVSYKKLDEENIQLNFVITDTGIGIRKEDISKIFDSFKRLDPEKNRVVQGTGLGLNITKQLVEQMHGTIDVQSEYGKGSTFMVAIPQKVMDMKPIGSLEKSLQESRKNKVRKALFTAPQACVLVVDDNSVNLALVKGLLKRTHVKVELASSGKLCLEMTKNKKYDIIFMDHMMPDMDGVETLHMLREDDNNPNKDGIVIALTANAVAGCREQYLGYGFDDYLPKPIQADNMEQMLVHFLPKDLVNMVEN